MHPAEDKAAGDIARTPATRWPMVLAGALTLLMVAGLARELFGGGLAALSATFPRDPGFYAVFALSYMTPPIVDWLIFRRLWALPATGLAALLKKRVVNEVVLGYSGDAYFYAWARTRLTAVAAPFAAVKDVTILSAIAGNTATLAAIAAALPFAGELLTPDRFRTLAGSAAILLAMSLPFLLLSQRVFSLPRRALWWVFGLHCLRLATVSATIALAWHLAMPDVAIGTWLCLAAGRLLISRLPLLPNKELLFANFAILLIGRGEAVSQLVALTAALTLCAHVTVILVLGLHRLVRGAAPA